jgi:beta-glucanase (GH16 family)
MREMAGEMMNRSRRVMVIGLASALISLSLLPGSGAPAQAQVVSPAALPAAVVVSAGTLVISPSDTKSGSITATFTKANIVKNRPVVLQSYNGTDWVQVGKPVKMNSSGVAVFKLAPALDTAYKAVAPKYSYKVKKKSKTAAAAETASRSLSQVFNDGFSGGDFDSTLWSRTLDNHFDVATRWCSAPMDANGTVSNGMANLTMSTVSSQLAATVKAATVVKQKAARQAAIDAANKMKKGKAKTKALKDAKAMKTNGCPTGVYGNARVSTEGKFSMTTGIVAARVKFPKAQGMHGGIWLRTVPDAGSELDMVEAFGLGKGIQNVIHIGKRDSKTQGTYETTEAKKWVAKSSVKKSSWWDKYHVFSMEWDTKKVTFRLDGVVTKVETPKTGIPSGGYYLVMSMLSSDWETGRLTKPTKGGKKAHLPESMQVDWVKAWTTPVA